MMLSRLTHPIRCVPLRIMNAKSQVRRLSFKPKKSTGNSDKVAKEEVNMTRAEVEKISESAKAEQKFWDLLVPERNIGFTHPFFWVLLGGCVGLHFYNGHLTKEREKEALEEQEIVKRAEKQLKSRLAAQKLDPEKVQEKIVFRRSQRVKWALKRDAAIQEGNHAQESAANQRIDAINEEMMKLEAQLHSGGNPQ